MSWGFYFFFSLFWGKNQTQVQVVQVYDYLYVQLFHFHLFGFIDFSLCVLPTTIVSESTNCDDPYQWYTMHREIKFVMIPDGSSSAPAYSLWKTLPYPPVVSLYVTHLFFTHWFAFAVFLPLMGGNGASTRLLCPISRLSSCSISIMCGLSVLQYSWGWQPTQLSRGCRKPPRDKAAVQPFWGQDMLLCWLALDSGTAVHMPPRYLGTLCAYVL